MSSQHFEVTEHGGIDPETESPRFVAKHLSAYYFTFQFAKGSALEIGFGDGYGASLLAEQAGQVTAIDLFEKNVEAARAKYPKPNLRFLQMSGTDLQWTERLFDLIVSFQVVEHIPQAFLPKYIGEIKRTLRPGGAVCLSTLNLSRNRKPGQPYDKSPHHDKEFTPAEFGEFLKQFFTKVDIYGLYPTGEHVFYERLKKSGVLRFLPEGLDPAGRFYKRITVKDFVWRCRSEINDCIDIMAVCRE